MLSISCSLNEFVQHQENKNTLSKSQRDFPLLKKNLVSRKELRETENVGGRDLDVLITNFLLQVHECLFLICFKKTVSTQILVLSIIESLRDRKCLVWGYIHTFFVSKDLTRSNFARSVFTQTSREYNPVRGTFL